MATHVSISYGDRPQRTAPAGDHTEYLKQLEASGKYKKLTGWGAKLLLKFLMHADWDSGLCYLSSSTLQEAIGQGKDRATTYRARENLIEAGVIEIIDRTKYDPEEFDDIPEHVTVYRVVGIKIKDRQSHRCDNDVAPVQQTDDKIDNPVAPVQQKASRFVNLDNRVAQVPLERERELKPKSTPTALPVPVHEVAQINAPVSGDAAAAFQLLTGEEWRISPTEAQEIVNAHSPIHLLRTVDYVRYMVWTKRIKTNPKVWMIRYLSSNGKPSMKYQEWNANGRPGHGGPPLMRGLLPASETPAPSPPEKKAIRLDGIDPERLREWIAFCEKQGNTEMVEKLQNQLRGCHAL